MSFLDDLMGNDGSEADRVASAFLRRYAQYQIGSRVADSVLPDSRSKLDEVDKRLSIRLKKKALGLPMSDDDYEHATNDGLSFTQKGAVAAFGKHVAPYAPAPDFLKGAPARGLMETSFPKTIASDAGEYLLSSGLRAAGGKYGGAIRGAGRFFGR